jgi:serine protease Do
MSLSLAAPETVPKGCTVASRVIAGVGRGMFMMAALALTMLGFVLGAPNAHADNQTQLDAQVKQSLVYVSIEYTGYVDIPAQYASDHQAGWSNELKADFSCSGFVVDPAGFIVTAGHCVDPASSEVKDALRSALFNKAVNSGSMTHAEAVNALQTANTQGWPVEGKQGGSPPDRNVQIIQPEGPGRVIDHFVTVQVVDFQKVDDGDNALLKVANMASLKALPVADKAPQPGTSLTSVGFPGSVGDAIDPSRLQEPSFKSGTASSQQVTPSGASNTEISAAVSAGMSGGPTVDNSTGEVLGLNDYTLNGETQAFNFITDASALRSFLLKNSVHLVTPPAPAKSFPWIWIAVGGAVVLVLVAVPVLLVVRQRAKRHSVRPIDGSQLLQPAPSGPPSPQQSAGAPAYQQWPPAYPQAPAGASEPPRQERSDSPQAQPVETPPAQPQPVAQILNGHTT